MVDFSRHFKNEVGLPRTSVVKKNYLPMQRCGFYPWVEKILWRRKWQPTPGFLLRNPMDRRAWQAAVHWVTPSWTQLKQLSTHTYMSMTLPALPTEESFPALQATIF